MADDMSPTAWDDETAGRQNDAERVDSAPASSGRRLRNLTLAAAAGLSGVIGLVVVFAALLIGLWANQFVQPNGLAVVCLLVISVPVSLVIMVWFALRVVARIDAPASRNTDQTAYPAPSPMAHNAWADTDDEE